MGLTRVEEDTNLRPRHSPMNQSPVVDPVDACVRCSKFSVVRSTTSEAQAEWKKRSPAQKRPAGCLMMISS